MLRGISRGRMNVRKTLLGAALGTALLIAGCGNATTHHVTHHAGVATTTPEPNASSPCAPYVCPPVPTVNSCPTGYYGCPGYIPPTPVATPTPAPTQTPTPPPTQLEILDQQACNADSAAQAGDWQTASVRYGAAAAAAEGINISESLDFGSLTDDASAIAADKTLGDSDTQDLYTYTADFEATQQYFDFEEVCGL